MSELSCPNCESEEVTAVSIVGGDGYIIRTDGTCLVCGQDWIVIEVSEVEQEED